MESVSAVGSTALHSQPAGKPEYCSGDGYPHQNGNQTNLCPGYQRHGCAVGPPPRASNGPRFDSRRDAQADSQIDNVAGSRPIDQPRSRAASDRSEKIGRHHDPGIAKRCQATSVRGFSRAQAACLIERELQHFPGKRNQHPKDSYPQSGMGAAPNSIFCKRMSMDHSNFFALELQEMRIAHCRCNSQSPREAL